MATAISDRCGLRNVTAVAASPILWQSLAQYVRLRETLRLRCTFRASAANLPKLIIWEILAKMPERAPVHDLLKLYTKQAKKVRVGAAEADVEEVRAVILERIATKLVRNPDAAQEEHTKKKRPGGEGEDAGSAEHSSLTIVTPRMSATHICWEEHGDRRDSASSWDSRAQRSAALLRTLLEFDVSVASRTTFLGADAVLSNRIRTGMRRNLREFFSRYWDFNFGDWWLNSDFLHPQDLKFKTYRARNSVTICRGIEEKFRSYVERTRSAGHRLMTWEPPNLTPRTNDLRAMISATDNLPPAEQASRLIWHAYREWDGADSPGVNQHTPCKLLVFLTDLLPDLPGMDDQQGGDRQKLQLEFTAGALFDLMEFPQFVLCAEHVDGLCAWAAETHGTALPSFESMLQYAIAGREIAWPQRNYVWE